MHFRNQLRYYNDYYKAFKELVEQSWQGIELTELVQPNETDSDRHISLIIRDGDFSAEVGWMGHGLQMWLQTMWFLSRSKESSVLILDEPDVYMHADLQRKLIRMLNADSRQFIVATHSPEMMSEVQPESVIILNRRTRKSQASTSIVGVQEILRHFGSVHNLSLSRLGEHNRILFVEGKDLQILKQFQDVIDPSARVPIDALPNTGIGGWSQWPSVLTIAKFFRENEVPIEIHCLFDSDYHLEDEKDKRYAEAKRCGVHLTILNSKELENYALVSRAIASLLSERTQLVVPTEEIEKKICELAGEMLDDVVDQYSTEIKQKDKSLSVSSCNKQARVLVNSKVTENGLLSVVGGKSLLSSLQDVVRDDYRTTFTISAVIKQLQVDEVGSDLRLFLKRLSP